MGGVDLLDSILGRYKISMRTRKWYCKIFYHLVDITIINAWLLYRRNERQIWNTATMSMEKFRAEIANCLCNVGLNDLKKRERPSSLDRNLEQKKKKLSSTAIPPEDVRTDNFGYIPNWSNTRQRCKIPGCKGFSFIFCEKCKVHLCLNKNKNCFGNFHQ